MNIFLKIIFISVIMCLNAVATVDNTQLIQPAVDVDDDIGQQIKKKIISKINNNTRSTEYEYFDVEKYDNSLICPNVHDIYKNKYHVELLDVDIQKGILHCIVKDNKTNKVVQNMNFESTITKNNFAFENDEIQQGSQLDQGLIDELKNKDYTTNDELDAYVQTHGHKDQFYEKRTRVNENEIDNNKLISASITLDDSIIDLSSTILSQQITLRGSHYRKNQEESESVINDEFSKLKEYRNEKASLFGLSIDLDKVFTKVNTENVDKSYVYIISILSKIADPVDDLLHKVLFCVLFISGAYLLYQNQFHNSSNDQSVWEIAGKVGILGASFSILLSSTTVQLKTADESLEISTSYIQKGIRMIYYNIDEMADNLAKQIILGWTDKLAVDMKSLDADTLIYQENIKVKLKKENTYLTDIVDQCYDQYDILLLQNFNNTLNPFFKSDLDTSKMIKKGMKIFKEGVNKQNLLNMSLCYNSVSKITSNNNMIALIENKIIDFNTGTSKNKDRDTVRAMKAMVWHQYDKYGYMSIPFLPVATAIIGLNNKIENLKEKYSALAAFDKEAAEELMMLSIKNTPYLLFFDVSTIQNISQKLISIVTDYIPFFGDSIAKIGSTVSTLIILDSSVQILPFLKLALFAALSILIFLFIIVQRMIVFLLLPFAAIYLLSTNSYQQLVKMLIKAGYIAVKPFTFVIVVAITMIITGLLDSIYYNYLADIMRMNAVILGNDSIVSIILSIFMNAIFTLIFLIAQFGIVFYMLTNLDNYIAKFLGIEADDLASSVTSKIESTMQKHLQ